MFVEVLLGLLVLFGFGLALYFYFKTKELKSTNISEEEAIAKASKKAEEKIEEAEREVDEVKEKAKKYAKKVRQEITEQENLMAEREVAINKRSKLIEEKIQEAETLKEKLKKKESSISKKKNRLKRELEKISQMTRDEAREQLMKEIQEDLNDYTAKEIYEAEKRIKEDVDEKAKHILVEAMHSVETDYVNETTTSTIKLEDENMKGRIIGKDGRNIRAFEKLTGVDLIIDESPNAIGISCFDPLRREIAKVALSKLIADGRIHPGTIEEEIRKAKKEIAAEIRKNGQKLADEAGWPGIDSDLLRLLGKLKYRTSYGQSLMVHTIEVTRLGSILATKLGADVELVKKACVLHDVGKLLTHKVEQPHHHISGEIARKYNLPDKLVNAIEGHHLDIEPSSIEAWIVHISDAISGARPGARRDNYEDYIKRVESLEKVAKEIGGDKVEEVFAIHAGREVRVLVKPGETTDKGIKVLAKEVADKIRETQVYPGTVKVNVIRENRAEEVAT